MGNADLNRFLACRPFLSLSDAQTLSDSEMGEYSLKLFQNVFHHKIRIILHPGNLLLD